MENDDEQYSDRYFQDLETPMHLIEEGLYLGSIDAARDRELLKQNNITRVLSLLDSFPDSKPSGNSEYDEDCYYYLRPFDSSFDHLKLTIQDSYTSNLIQHLPAALKFISDSQKAQKNILVHCAAGISRSSSVVIAYIMVKYSLSLQEGIHIVKDKRRCICPNDGFKRQLMIVRTENFKQYIE